MLTTTNRFAATVAACLALATALCGCTDSEPPPPPVSGSSTPLSAVPTRKELTPKERASQLTALAPTTFDATYRLTSKGKRPNPKVRIRADGRLFRLDLQQGRATSVLLTGGRGIVSCRIEEPRKKSDKKTKSKVCYLVSGALPGLPGIFDPELQRLFRSTRSEIALSSKTLKVEERKPWAAPKPLGPSECFDVRGKDLEAGTYCFLSRPGPFIGLLARAKFPSGDLSIREVNRGVRKGKFTAPVRPTPLPN